jgi:CRP-like cAMP-binding protein
MLDVTLQVSYADAGSCLPYVATASTTPTLIQKTILGTRQRQKNLRGDCMYLIVSGRLKAHDGDHLLNYLEEGDVFGEMAVLDPEPRLASITAVEDAYLLRLDQEQPFYELMDDHLEVARGVIHVLSGHLRNRVQDVTELRNRLKVLEPNQLA